MLILDILCSLTSLIIPSLIIIAISRWNIPITCILQGFFYIIYFPISCWSCFICFFILFLNSFFKSILTFSHCCLSWGGKLVALFPAWDSDRSFLSNSLLNHHLSKTISLATFFKFSYAFSRNKCFITSFNIMHILIPNGRIMPVLLFYPSCSKVTLAH